MMIGGFEPFSLIDYPGRIAAVVFTQGCNFRCPFCHNGSLISPRDGSEDVESLLKSLVGRRGKLDAVVVSGGEPTLQPDLAGFLALVRSMGFLVKIDTNGSRPSVLRSLIDQGLLDYVAMDVKAPIHKYSRLAGVEVDVESLRESVALIASSGIAHEFRTTHVEALLDDQDLAEIRAGLPRASSHRIQRFRPENALDSALRQGPDRTCQAIGHS